LRVGEDAEGDSSTCFFPASRNPKKRGPFHAVPVMAWAMVDKLL
jgi:hypothetical protein